MPTGIIFKLDMTLSKEQGREGGGVNVTIECNRHIHLCVTVLRMDVNTETYLGYFAMAPNAMTETPALMGSNSVRS